MREEIENIIRNLAKTRSVNQITMNEVAKEAGVSRQTIYRYIGDKSEIKRILGSEDVEVDTRNKILQGAYQTFAQYGYTQATLDQVANKSGYTKGAVYWHFKSKEDLFIALLDQRLEKQMNYITSQLENVFNSSQPIKGLADIFETILSLCEKDPDWPKISLEFMAQSRNHEIQRKMSDAQNKVQKQVAQLISQMQKKGLLSTEINPLVLTKITTSLLDGLMITSIMNCDGTIPKKLSEEIAYTLWNGIAPKD